jgi:hypothetical protein
MATSFTTKFTPVRAALMRAVNAHRSYGWTPRTGVYVKARARRLFGILSFTRHKTDHGRQNDVPSAFAGPSFMNQSALMQPATFATNKPYIGKESNKIEDVQAATVLFCGAEQDVAACAAPAKNANHHTGQGARRVLSVAVNSQIVDVRACSLVAARAFQSSTGLRGIDIQSARDVCEENVNRINNPI